MPKEEKIDFIFSGRLKKLYSIAVTIATHLIERILFEGAKIDEVIAMRINICITNDGNYIEDGIC